MRAILPALVATTAFADEPPEGSVREQAIWDDGLTLGIDTSLRVRSDGKPAVGAGLATRFSRGPWTGAVSVMRWHPLQDDDPERSWELAVRGYRHLAIGDRARAHVVGGLSVERVEIDDGKYGRAGVMLGAGMSWKLLDRVTAWTELTLESKRWITRPEDRSAAEWQLMFTLGFTF